MIQFILNQKLICTELPSGTLLLDFIRYHQNLKGTKIGCREGDCGACTVLVGRIKNGQIRYQGMTSCLMAIGNANGAHIVTIEGINIEGLNAVQQAFAGEGATQCGFCTPGFIVSLTGFCLDPAEPLYQSAIDAMNGNICRCTGYKSIERAALKVVNDLKARDNNSIEYAVENGYVPSYFSGIKRRLEELGERVESSNKKGAVKVLGGGTDLYVQQHSTMIHENILHVSELKNNKSIWQEDNYCVIRGTATVTELADSELMKVSFPRLEEYIKLISSTQIRNMATIAGNLINASPIGDLTIFFLALDASIRLGSSAGMRELKLRDLYLGYKKLDKRTDELVNEIRFELPAASKKFNFEKVSKRTWLDIASVNTAVSLDMDEDVIVSAHLSAGGVSAVPLYLLKASEYLRGKRITGELVNHLIDIVQSEISPISDARGSEDYKRLLLSQLVKAHFHTLFPGLPVIKFLHT